MAPLYLSPAESQGQGLALLGALRTEHPLQRLALGLNREMRVAVRGRNLVPDPRIRWQNNRVHTCPECGCACNCESGGDDIENCDHYLTPECSGRNVGDDEAA